MIGGSWQQSFAFSGFDRNGLLVATAFTANGVWYTRLKRRWRCLRVTDMIRHKSRDAAEVGGESAQALVRKGRYASVQPNVENFGHSQAVCTTLASAAIT